MNEIAARIAGEALLKGAFEVFDAMLSTAFDHRIDDPVPLSEESAAALLTEFGVTMQAQIQNELGAIALLFSVNDAAQFAAMIQETEFTGASVLSEEDRAVLQEIADPALSGGVASLLQRVGAPVEPVDDAAVNERGPDGAPALAALLETGACAARFHFNDPSGIAGEGAILFSAPLIERVPEDMLVSPTARESEFSAEAELSPEEMSDILSGFGAAATDSTIPSEPAYHGNLDMVLDIGLVATARLGHVEMPIGEILNLGPGSIIEVGHLVDEPVDLLVNGKLIARGDVVVVDEKFGLRITEIVSTRARIESLR